MPKITLDIPEQNVALFLEVTEAIGINTQNFIIKDDVPDWHKQVLNERVENYRTGKTSVSEWKEFEKALDKEDGADEI